MSDERHRAAELQERLGVMVQASGKGYAIVDYDALDKLVSKLRCRHTTAPSGYVAWHEWAERKSMTHQQKRCPVCGRWAIWTRKCSGDER